MLPDIVSGLCASLGADAILDIGAKDNFIGPASVEKGLCYLHLDIGSLHNPDLASSGVVVTDLQSRIVLCLDVAEYVDIERLGDFIYDLAGLIDRFGIISISTRPSAQPNLFHASVLPIETWKYMLDLAGLQAKPIEEFEACWSAEQSCCDSQALLAVSHWQRRNIFRDDPSHQHFLLLEKQAETGISRNRFVERVEAILDIGYRRAKREQAAELELPLLIYHISFVQDWPFLRAMLDLWPAEKVRVLIRPDLIVPAYRELIECFLSRRNVPSVTAKTLAEAEQALDGWRMPSRTLFVTATEGLRTVVHGLGSLVAVAARRRGFTTVCLQHGHEVDGSLAMGSQFFGAVDRRSVKHCEAAMGGERTCHPFVLGSPKHLDAALVPADPAALSFRLGGHCKDFRKRVLVGTNLHWVRPGAEVDSLFFWLKNALSKYPDTLFVLRPHPDDHGAFSRATELRAANLTILDEATLLCIDWPVARVISSVDAVLSTPSTLVEDALVARKPTAILSDGPANAMVRNWIARGALPLAHAQFEAGELPAALFEDLPKRRSNREPESLNPGFYRDLCGKMQQPDSQALINAAEASVQRSFLDSCRYLNLDSHPHNNRESVTNALRRFVSQR